MTTWDPDGAGPKPELLVVGGSFSVAGNVLANNIAAWDGSKWQPLGTGIGGTYPDVSALTVYNGELIAGGYFTTAGGVPCNFIARWDGSQWRSLGTGMSGYVYALTVYNGALSAGGPFTIAGGELSAYFARWGIPDDCGAYCLAGGTCELRTEIGCLTVGGDWQGAGTVCEPNPCVTPGDVNCDGQVNFGDINPFVLLLTNPAGWQAMYPNCPMLNGDINQDGVVNFGDINPFVRLLTNP